FVPLLYSILEQSGEAQGRSPQYLVGEGVSLSDGSSNSTSSVKVQKPNGTTIELRPSEKFSQTDLPGIYSFTSPDGAQQFAVNVDPFESRTAPLSTDDLEKFGVPVKQPSFSSREQMAKKRVQLHRAELEGRQKLWRWFLAAAILVLMAETLLSGILS